MLFKKNKGLSVMHYAGIPGFLQDTPCFMNIKDDVVEFTSKAGASIVLPTSKIKMVEVLPEPNYMLKYHNAPASTAKVGAKWYGVISYNSESTKQIAFWFIDIKTSKALYALQSKCTPTGGVLL